MKPKLPKGKFKRIDIPKFVKLAKKGDTWDEARGAVQPLAQLRRRAEEGRTKQESMRL